MSKSKSALAYASVEADHRLQSKSSKTMNCSTATDDSMASRRHDLATGITSPHSSSWCMIILTVIALLAGLFAAFRPASICVAEPTPKDHEFFEKSIGPVLAEHCYSCHGPEKHRGGLRVDSRASLLKGGDHGAAIVPGKPTEGRLLKVVRVEGSENTLPKHQLPETAIKAIKAWIEVGAPWPETSKP